MANIIDDKDFFKERKSLEDIFLEYRPYNLRETLIKLNVGDEEEDEDTSLDDDLLTIDLTKKKIDEDIGRAIDESDDA